MYVKLCIELGYIIYACCIVLCPLLSCYWYYDYSGLQPTL